MEWECGIIWETRGILSLEEIDSFIKEYIEHMIEISNK